MNDDLMDKLMGMLFFALMAVTVFGMLAVVLALMVPRLILDGWNMWMEVFRLLGWG